MTHRAYERSTCQLLERRLYLDAADFNNDDDKDLLYHDRETGQVTVVYLDDGERIIGSGTIATVANLDWKVVAVGDIDGDDRPDLLWQNDATGRLLLWRLNNRQILGFVSYPSANPAIWEFSAAAEVDDEDDNSPGDDDDHHSLLWRHRSDGRLVLWQMDGRQIFRTMQLPGETNRQWEIAGMGEVELEANNQVDVQVLWRHASTGDNRIWRIDDNRLIDVVNLQRVGPAWAIAGFVDAEGDDDEGDIYWRNYSTGQNLKWEFDDDYVRDDVDVLPPEPNTNKVLFVGHD